MATDTLPSFDDAIRSLGEACSRAAQSFRELNETVLVHREQWLCTYAGQWPDRFVLLNRYVRTGVEPPFIFND